MNARYEIERLLAHTEGDLRLSQGTILLWNERRNRLTVNYLMLATITHEHKDIMTFEIKSRDYEEIISEIQEMQTRAYAMTAEHLNNKLANGYAYR